ncbi:hypothetical protein SCACP_05980 [Sporomusa carbonis]|uniref:methyl-accepting chemotaxis protein n=1 Tax=Sporomusa carbonis TaxID=3076075 RepID=UPI003A65FAA0
MQWLHNIKISAKIMVLLVTMAVFIGVVGFTGYYYSDKMSIGMDEMYKDYLLPVKWINAVRSETRTIEAITMEIFQPNVDKAREQKLVNEVKEHVTEVDRLLDSYGQSKLDEFQKGRLTELKQELTAYRTEREKAVEIALSGKNQEGYTYFIQHAAARIDKVNQMLAEVADYNAKRADEINAAGKRNAVAARMIITVITLAALAISLPAGIFLSRMIVRRLKYVVSILQQVAEGNLTQTVNVTAKDEIGRLGCALDATIGHLNELVGHIVDSAEQVTAASEELTASAEQSAQATAQISNSVDQVSRGSDKQLKAIDESTTAVEQLSASIQQIAANANAVAAVAAKTSDAAQDGGRSVESAVAQMATIDSAVARTAEVIAKLGERSREIGAIVDTIAGIAGQTNLLALNAAIEAARAGEQGRGFAVVAEEVRQLAEQSQAAAKEIASLIREVQGDTDKAVDTMDDGTREVKAGIEVVKHAGQSFQDIVTLVKQVSDEIRDISSAIQQMAAGSQNIVASIRDIDQISKQTTGLAQTVSAATEEQTASVQEIAASSQSLVKMAEGLKNAVSKFEV